MCKSNEKYIQSSKSSYDKKYGNSLKKTNNKPNSCDSEELKRMFAPSKYRGTSLLNKKHYTNDIKYFKKIYRNIYIIFWGWFFFSICSGWTLCYFISPPDFIMAFYSNYIGYVKRYDLFCMSMMLAILSYPIAFLLSFREWYKVARIPSFIGRIILMIMAFTIIYISTGLDGLGPIGKGGGRGDIRTLFAVFCDWLGAVWLDLIFFSFVPFAVATSLKFKEN